MKILAKDADALVAGMLPQLRKTTMQSFMEKVPGHTLINIYHRSKDDQGNLVHPGQDYNIMVQKPVAIDHETALRKIIKKAKSAEEMQDRMADYLLQNATDEVLQEAAKSFSNNQK